MSTNGVNVEDTDMSECDGEKVVTMMDVLQEQQEFEEDANAVLGASDDKNCTYNKGYIKRQALYACLTCCGDAKEDPTKRAGVCLACSLACHENHDLIELYTKRNFRCDCGNPKFQHPCTYIQNKTELNDENHYDQNFSGLYCICHRPYPDPDGIEEEMIQCIICEDWLHASHLEATIPSSDSYAEMVCKACMGKNKFLHDYSEFAVNGDVDVLGIDENEKSFDCDEGSKTNGVVEESKVAEDENKVEEKSKDITDETKPDTDSTEATDASPTNNETVDETTVKNENTENSNGHKSLDIENKITENESEHATTQEVPIEKPLSDEKLPITNTEAENSQDDVDMTSENSKAIESSTSETINAANNADGSSINETKVENGTEIQQDEGSSDVAMKTITSDENTVSKEENSTNSEVNGEDQQAETFETKAATDVVETKSDDVETKSDDVETKCVDIETKTDVETKCDDVETKTDDVETKCVDIETKTDVETKCDDVETKTDDLETKTDDEETKINETETGNTKPSEEAKFASNEHSDSRNNEQVSNTDKPVDSNESNGNSSTIKQDNAMDESTSAVNNEITKSEHKRKHSIEDDEDVSVKKPKLGDRKCIRPKNRKIFKGATFWPSHFRQKLCTCNECITMYKDLSVLFLLDPEDTVSAYETLGKEQIEGVSTSSYEKGLEALSSLGRIQQINAVTEYNKMRDKLLDFLKSFKDRKEVVKEEDIKSFFANMKPKREPDGVYFCR